MKRIVLSVLGTVLGLIALLSFKSHDHQVIVGQLPSAALRPSTSSSAGPSASGAGSTSSAPPDPAPSSSVATPSSSPKSYTGAAVDTRYGTVQVKLTLAAGKITDVSFVQLTSQDGRSADINSQAAPLLLQETLAAQGSNIDTISGATFTSEGYLQSLQSALDQAAAK
jgi:uncharacterized protein with FMN-binding domain